MREKYESLALTDLKALAKVRGLKGISAMKKAELVELMLTEDERTGGERQPGAGEAVSGQGAADAVSPVNTEGKTVPAGRVISENQAAPAGRAKRQSAAAPASRPRSGSTGRARGEGAAPAGRAGRDRKSVV